MSDQNQKTPLLRFDTVIVLMGIIITSVINIGSGYMQWGTLTTKVDYIGDELRSIQARTQNLDTRLNSAEKEISLLKYILQQEGKGGRKGDIKWN
jgi:hypothetical protein